MTNSTLKINLGTPESGWALLTIGDTAFSASYLTDVVMDILHSGKRSLQYDMDFCVSFDTEENGIYRVISDDFETIVLIPVTEGGYHAVVYSFGKRMLLNKFSENIRSNIEGWTDWFQDGSTEKELRERRRTLEAWLKAVEYLSVVQ